MKLPILEYPVTVGGVTIAICNSEAEASDLSGRLTQAAADTHAMLTGSVGYGPSKRIVETDDASGFVLDLPALAEAFTEREVEREKATPKGVESVVPALPVIP